MLVVPPWWYVNSWALASPWMGDQAMVEINNERRGEQILFIFNMQNMLNMYNIRRYAQ
jgi:hypothetical protein